MSTIYAGRPGNETIPTPLVVINATNATPIEVQTSAAHGLASGERVLISGVVGNAAANALAYIVVTDADKFLLYATFTPGGWVTSPIAGSGGYVSGGSVQPLGFATTLQLPSDGDPINAASVNNATEGEADREAWLVERTGAYRLVQFVQYGIDAPGGTDTTTAPGGIQPVGEVTYLATDLDATYPLGIDVIPGDVLEIEATGAVFLDGNQAPLALQLGIEIQPYGVSWTGNTTQADPFSRQTMGRNDVAPVANTATYFSYCLRSRILPSIAAGCQVKPRMFSIGLGLPARTTFIQRGSFAYRVQVWRAN